MMKVGVLQDHKASLSAAPRHPVKTSQRQASKSGEGHCQLNPPVSAGFGYHSQIGGSYLLSQYKSIYKADLIYER
jgi:hypothetical protein